MRNGCGVRRVLSTLSLPCRRPIDSDLALVAADLSLEYKLPMADAIILATGRFFNAEVVTSDADFEGVPGVTYIPKPAESV